MVQREKVKHLEAIAIIPARAGSKRVSNKNTRSFCGEPIIKYSIDIARKSNLFDEIMVSTESKKIAKIATSLGAEIPFMRSKRNASDKAGLAEVALEVIEEYKRQNITFDYFCLVFATAPMIEKRRLIEGYKLVREKDVDSVIPVVEFDYPIQRALEVKKAIVSMVDKKNLKKRSQDLPVRYHDAGKFYWIKTARFLQEKDFFMPKSRAIILPKSMAQDIDDEEDFKIAELKYAVKHFKFDWLKKDKEKLWGRSIRWIILALALLSSVLIMG